MPAHAAMGACSVAERKRRVLEEQAAALMLKLDATSKLKLKIQEKKVRTVGHLKRGPAIQVLTAHALIQQFGLNAEAVYAVLERMLGEKSAPTVQYASAPKPGEISSETTCPVCGGQNIGVDQQRGRAFFGCMSCGVELGSCIDYSNPYREFSSEHGRRESRSHWQSVGDKSEHDEHHYVDVMVGALKYSTALGEAARQKIREFPRVGAAANAAAAAIILCSMEYDPNSGVLKQRPPPSMLGVCAKCGATCGSKRDARFHCREVSAKLSRRPPHCKGSMSAAIVRAAKGSARELMSR